MNERNETMTSRKHRGFSLLELMITVSIAMILMGATFITLRPILYRGHVDSAYDKTLMVLRNTRHLAITQSHEYVVTLNAAAGTIQVQYQPPAVGGIFPPLQAVNNYSLPVDVSFAVQGGFPAAAPDSFGTGVTAVDFGYGPPGPQGGQNTIVFMPDGSSRDINTGGNYNSGVVYLTRPGDTIYSSRAITVWGATGRVRGWRLIQQAGAPIWTQQ